MYVLIEDTEKFPEFIEALAGAKVVSIDTETTGLDPYTATLLLLQVGIEEKVFVFDARKLGKRLISYIVAIIKDSDKLCIFQNAGFDLKILYHNTGELLTKLHDTMICDQILEAGKIHRYYPSLTLLAEKYLGEEVSKDVRSTFIDFEGEFTEEQLEYSAKDVLYLEKIYELQYNRIVAESLLKVYDLEMKAVPVFSMMEYNGMRIDIERWTTLSQTAEANAEQFREEFFAKIIDDLYITVNPEDAFQMFEALSIPVKTKKFRLELESITFEPAIKNAIREYLNLSSPLQLKSTLGVLSIEVPDTNKKTLEKIKNPIIENILKYRQEAKSVSSFGEAFLGALNPVSGRIHTSYGQIGAATGRTSSWNPNLQNIKRESEYRECFIAWDETWDVITADYSQAELRLLGDVTREPKLIEAYEKGWDLHAYTASLIFEKPLEEVTKEERRIGKTLNFAIVYGSSKYGLYYNFGIPLEDGERFLNAYFANYSVLDEFMSVAGELIYKKGFSLTPIGRKRYFVKKDFYPGGNREWFREKSAIIREGINHIIQGGSADITKMAMVKVFYNNPFGDKLKVLHMVHDEIVCMAKKDISEDAAEFITKCMNEAADEVMRFVKSETDYEIKPYWSK